MARRGKRGLSTEDKALWEKVTQSATPLNPPARNRAVDPIPTPPSSPRPAEPGLPRDRLPAFRIGETSSHKPHPPQPERDLSARLAHAPVRMDHGVFRRMQRGKLKPEGRIDLHGMTLAQAHPVLTRFILDASADGKRLVLVITGKGKDRETPDPIPIRRGVLRHQVPNWLHAPPLGAVVLDIREAHQRHGGGGAYYVYLKKRR
jgi:DNA-nicking Smr family endonuclease